MSNIGTNVERIWLEAHVPAGSNIIESAREMARMSSELRQPMCAGLNGYWLHILPGTHPDTAAKEVSQMLMKRNPA